MSTIGLSGVTKRFGSVTALDRLDLDVRDGEFMVVLGPSGCGKTTVLRLVAGLDSMTGGTVRIGNRVVNDVDAKDRDVSMVFQSYALYPHMSVLRNIESPLLARHLRRDERDRRAREVAATLGLTDLLDRKPRALSGGQRQRVALARAIVARPAAFLMDEPLSNLDAKLRVQTRLELADLHRRLGTTTLYVTHDQVEAMTLASRLAVLDQGRLQQLGTPREVYERPRNLFVARFIGSPPMNTIPAAFAADGPGGVVRTRAGSLRWAGLLAPGEVPANVVAGVRPEHLTIGSPGLSATVLGVEWLGAERHVVCDVAGTTMTVRETGDGTTPSAGDRVTLTCDPGRVHLFDPHTTERLV